MKSQYAGTCNKDSNHTWKIGDEIFISKGSDGKWIMCTDKDCYVSQGGKISDPNKPKFTPNKFPITEAIPIYELTEELLTAFKNKRKIDFTMEQEMVFVESVFRTLSGNFKP